MAAIEPIDIIELGVGDAQAGLVLSTEAGWNQNEADWRFFLSKGVVFGVRDGNRLVATAALLPYSAGHAWISMVLVTTDFRRRGIATKLVDACLDVATRRGLTTWLDATPAGATVYGPLGFIPSRQLRRLRLTRPQGTGASRTLSAGTSTHWPFATAAPWGSIAVPCSQSSPHELPPASYAMLRQSLSSAMDAPRGK